MRTSPSITIHFSKNYHINIHFNFKIFLLFLLVSLFGNIYQSIGISTHSATIKGRIKADYPINKLVVSFCPYYVIGNGNELIVKEFPVNPDGTFDITIYDIKAIARIKIYETEGYNFLLKDDLIEPGDSVFLDAAVINNKLVKTAKGMGADKYNCSFNLDTVKYDIFYEYRDTESIDRKFDSLRNLMMSILTPYKETISDVAYEIMYNDITGKLAFSYIFSVFDISDPSLARNRNTLYEKFKQFTNKIKGSGKYENLSPSMIRYLYNKEKTYLLFKDSKKISFESLFKRIVSNYSGATKEQLLAYLFRNKLDINLEFGGINPASYKQALKEAMDITSIPEVKNVLTEEYNKRTLGSEFLNFSLRKDSTNESMSLSSLRGKVILLDFWGYTCTGCYLFSKAFHEKIFPKLKNDTNFVVVSVMLDTLANFDHYMRRLRRIENTTYTYPEYTNLYAGKGSNDASKIFKYYNIDIVPTIFLINKDGKLISSTIPFFTDSNSQNVANLTELIENALGRTTSQVLNSKTGQ